MKVRVLIFMVVFGLFLGCGSCPTKPDAEDYDIAACYHAADCLYYNHKNPDKTICADPLKECRTRDRYNYCLDKTHLPEGIDFEKCMLLLNQK